MESHPDNVYDDDLCLDCPFNSFVDFCDTVYICVYMCSSLVTPCMYVYYTVVESHPDNVHDDLRLDRPFNSFVDFCDSLDLNAMTRKVSHIVPPLEY